MAANRNPRGAQWWPAVILISRFASLGAVTITVQVARRRPARRSVANNDDLAIVEEAAAAVA